MELIREYLEEVSTAIRAIQLEPIDKVIEAIFQVWREGRYVYVLGNGGSAATASHVANDFSKGTLVPGKARLRALALTDNVPLLTAWANDKQYEEVFAEQLRNLVGQGDLVLGISASGNSENVLRAIQVGKEAGARTVGWTGRNGGRLLALVELCIQVPSDDIGQIEDGHMILDHVVTTGLRRRISRAESSA